MNVYLYIGLYCAGWLVMLAWLRMTPPRVGRWVDMGGACLWPILLPVVILLTCGRLLAQLGRR